MAQAEEQRVLVIVKVESFSVAIREQGLQLSQRLTRDQGLLLSADVLERFACLLNVCQAVTVGCDHGERLRLQNEQSAIQGITRFLVGNGENSFRDHALDRS